MVTIKEAEMQTGITKQNIRYYEKKVYCSRRGNRKISTGITVRKISED